MGPASTSATPALTLYGAAGSGSVAVEAALTLLGVPYELIERVAQLLVKQRTDDGATG